jgi:hypothetical protein
MTLNRMTLNRMTLNRMTLNRMTLNRMTLNRMALNIMPLALNRMPHKNDNWYNDSRITLIRMTLKILEYGVRTSTYKLHPFSICKVVPYHSSEPGF